MYNSGIPFSRVFELLSDDIDISRDINSSHIVRWICSIEQLLYSDIIKDYRTCEITMSGNSFSEGSLSAGDDEKKPTFDDIVKVYVGATELVRTSVIGAYQFQNDLPIYWYDGKDIQIRTTDSVKKVTVIYKTKPDTDPNYERSIKIPYEWFDIVLAKVRGEAYKLAGDDTQAAKWLGDFNSQLESFKVWCAERQKWYGE